jgi:outer membrane protein assembly factor BamD
MLQAKRAAGRTGRRSGRIFVVAALAAGLAGCGGIDTSGLGGGMADYLWGDGSSSRSSGTPTAAALSSGDAIAPEMANIDDAEPIAKLYNAGLDNLKSRNYRSASNNFAEVERQHPYSIWATRAILMQAYAQYMRNAYDDAVNAAQRFLALHPGHKDAPYAYYLIALSYYEQINDVKRDQTSTAKALQALDEISRRFPGTPYARDAEAKAVLARDHLAGKEMEVGRYYQGQSAHLAAINRFKTVITDYQTTTHAPEALYRLTETYLALGVQSEAQTAAAVLGYNYPSSQWYKDAFALLRGQGLEPHETEGSWISQAIRTVNPFSG